jgi:hypothetical protein
MRRAAAIAAIAVVTVFLGGRAGAGEPSAEDLHREVVDDDPWGRGGGEVKATAHVTDGDRRRELAFEVRSLMTDPPLFRSVLRFYAPADVAGVGFLVVQMRGADDDRYLFLPELQRSRRIAASRRREVFMGTDFSYGDMDRRELRNADARLTGEDTLGKYPVYVLELVPTDDDAQYGRIEVWVRKDNHRPIKYALYDKRDAKLKTLLVKEIRRIDGRWFTTRSVMIDHRKGSKTELHLESVDKKQLAPEAFTVNALERL